VCGEAEDAFSLRARGVRACLSHTPLPEGSHAFAKWESVGTLRPMDDEALKKIFPGIKDDELQSARENLDAYLELAWEIFEDMKVGTHAVDRDPEEL
jgi:hypothetical protein